MGWNPFLWGPKAVGKGLGWGWAHGGQSLLGGLAKQGAHAAGPSLLGGTKAALSHLSLAKLLAILGFILTLIWQALLGAYPQLDRAVQGLVHPASYNASLACTPLPVGGAAGIGYRFGGFAHKLTEPPPDAEQMRAGMETAGRQVGQALATGWHAFQSAVKGGTAPVDPAQPVAPTTQVSAPSPCCPTGPASIPASSTDEPAVVAARAVLKARLPDGRGFPNPLTAQEVLLAESGANPNAANPHTSARGIFQIMLSAHPGLLPGETWRDPQANANAALIVLRDAGWDWGRPWAETYSSGRYLKFEAQAVQALAKARGALGPFPPVVPVADPIAQPVAVTCTPTVPTSGSPTVEAAIAYALAQVGKPYVWGAEGPNAFDCSGLVDAAFKLPGRPTTSTLIGMGVAVDPSQIQRGDLVFPDSGHVVIYLGGGMIVEAPHPGANVRGPVPIYGVWRARRLVGVTTV
jgi:cell wall-associated NlpC family hydrolase